MMIFWIALTGCSTIHSIEYIKQSIPELPEAPDYYSVMWQKWDGNYCVDEDNAKNLLKNRTLDKGYQMELKDILEGLKNGK